MKTASMGYTRNTTRAIKSHTPRVSMSYHIRIPSRFGSFIHLGYRAQLATFRCYAPEHELRNASRWLVNDPSPLVSIFALKARCRMAEKLNVRPPRANKKRLEWLMKEPLQHLIFIARLART